MAPTFESVRNCRIHEEADGVLINAETNQPFSYKDACVVHGPPLGHDALAAEAATDSVETFLKRVFKLD